MSSLIDLSALEIGVNVLKLTVDIFSNLTFNISVLGEYEEEIFDKFLNDNKIPVNFSTKKVSYSFETKQFYIKLLHDLYAILYKKNTKIEFNSYYSFLYFLRINNYLKFLLSNSKNNIVENPKVKIYLHLSILHIRGDKEARERIGLNEGFFVGTFEELKRDYHEYEYKDTENIKNNIEKMKKYSQRYLKDFLVETFQDIVDHLRLYGKQDDNIINKMLSESNDILYSIKSKFSDDFIKKIKDFYNTKNYLIIINFFSEMKYNCITIKNKVDSNFLSKENESKYFDIGSNNDEYKQIQTKFRSRMLLSYPKICFDMGLDNEIVICSLLEADNCQDCIENYKILENLKNNIENLHNNKIREYIKIILNENEIYKFFFSILKCDIIKQFFDGILYIGKEANEFQKVSSQIEDSECFEKVYNIFLKEYDKSDFKEFKNLILIKTLSKGDRACVLTHLKRYVINPSQLFIGTEISSNEHEIEDILKGYLIVILLYETEHFLRLLDEGNKNVKAKTPRNKEGGRLFIKYLFGVESISHINDKQAKDILNLDNWKDHEKIKSIFKGQVEEDVNEYTVKKYPQSISFYSTRKTTIKTAKISAFISVKK